LAFYQKFAKYGKIDGKQ